MTPGPWLEQATDLDTPALAALEARCHSHPWNEKQFREEVALRSPHATLVLRGAPSGPSEWRGIRAYAVYRVIADEMHVLNVTVAPQWRGRGLARWILGLSLARAARAGARQAFLEVRRSNVAARSLYETLGFVQVGRRPDYYVDPREDALVFRRLGLAMTQP